jgi:hypothetical protein
MTRLIETAAEVTGNLLGFARGGKYQVDTLDINQVVDMALNVFQPGEKNIVIKKKPAPDLYKVNGDRSQLEQVLLNLLVNGSQAMVDGGTLTIETRNITIKDTNCFHFDVAPGTYVEISVQDTGIGMDETIQKKIFDPFFSTKMAGDIKRRGLGLSTVFGIVKNHGGFITVESNKNAGALFRVALPSSAPVDFQRVEEESDGFDLMPKGKETVLIVDDENEVLEVGVTGSPGSQWQGMYRFVSKASGQNCAGNPRFDHARYGRQGDVLWHSKTGPGHKDTDFQWCQHE